MFNQLNIDSPFYINNNFDFSSDSESDSDNDFDMSALNQIHTSGSTIHKSLIKFFNDNPIPEDVFNKNLKTLEILFNAKVELWTAYSDAVNNYSNDATEEERLKFAIEIGNAAVKIRQANEQTKLTVITEGVKEVTIAGLTAEEIIQLKELHELVIAKMQGTGQKGNAERANKMVEEFKSDMEFAKIDNTFPSKWIKNHGVWKCVQHELQAGRNLDYSEDDEGALDLEAWKKVVEIFNNHKDDAPPQTGTTLQGASNKFAVDVYCATINRYKNKIPVGQQSWAHFKMLLQKVSAHQNKSSIKKSEWLLFIAANENCKPFFVGIDEGNSLYDNPGKLTKARLFACSASVFPAPEPLALFGVKDRLSKIPKMIAAIYEVEKKFNIIDKNKGTTSNSEHLCHLLLTLGSQHAYVWNRNHISHSIREITFNLN